MGIDGRGTRDQLQQILEQYGLRAAVAQITAMVSPSVSVRRKPLATDNWPALFQAIALQVRAHHEKQGFGGHVVKRKPIMERERIVVPAGPLAIEAGQYYDAIGEYLCREVLPESILPLGTSRLGGQPDMPSTVQWPTWNVPEMRGQRRESVNEEFVEHIVREASSNAKLTFLAQLNLAELRQQVPTHDLPDQGMLLFFYDSVGEPWGYDPIGIPGHRVIHVPPGQPLVRQICPDLEHCLAPAPAFFEAIETFPKFDEDTLDWSQLGIDSSTIDWYGRDDALRKVRAARPQHHMFGHAYQVQPGSMEAECQLVSHGFNCGDDAGWAAGMAAPGIVDGIKNWRLLLQFDSEDTDDGLGAMWGDCGLLYFWIEQQRLLEKDFSNTCAIVQGS